MGKVIIITSKFQPDVCLKLLMDQSDCGINCVKLLSEEKNLAECTISFKFSIHKKINYRNGFQTYLYGYLVRNNHGSLATCRLGISRQAKAGLIVANVLMMAFAWQRIFISKHRIIDIKNWSQEELIGLAVPVVICALMWVMVFAGKALAASEGKGLTQFLEGRWGARS